MNERSEGSEKPRRCRVQETPPSAARSAEGRDATYYCCGGDCEPRWLQERPDPDHAVRSE